MGVRFAIGRPRHIGRCGDGIFCASALGRRRRTFAAVQLEHDLHFFVTFIILPVFAFTNAGVNFSGMSPTALLHSIPLGITLGLLFGKIIGISGATWAAVRWAGCEKPRDCSWMAMFGVAAICVLALRCRFLSVIWPFPPFPEN